jgi:hypothetical protein
MMLLKFTLESAPIGARPQCPKCPALMYLAAIERGKAAYDLGTFECPRCQHDEPALAPRVDATDSFEGGAACAAA